MSVNITLFFGLTESGGKKQKTEHPEEELLQILRAAIVCETEEATLHCLLENCFFSIYFQIMPSQYSPYRTQRMESV